MAEDTAHIDVRLTRDEARLIVAALRQFEPFWPHDLDDVGRAELLASIRDGVDRLSSELRREYAGG